MKKNTVWASFAFEPFGYVHDEFEFNPLFLPRLGEGLSMGKYKLEIAKNENIPIEMMDKIDDVFIVSNITWEDVIDGWVNIDLRPQDYLQKHPDSDSWTALQWQDWIEAREAKP
jgi:hypothetical protein